MIVTVLFARSDSIYKTLPGVDVYDAQRNALNFPGGTPVIAHPPCRAWGQLSHMAKPVPGERELALWAIEQVRKNGGVLEHPRQSKLWPAAQLPRPGYTDDHGGWTLPILQSDFGHRAKKATYLYIVGVEPKNIPQLPIILGDSTHIIGTSGRRRNGRRLRPGEQGYKPECTHPEREHTPILLAKYLIELAEKCSS